MRSWYDELGSGRGRLLGPPELGSVGPDASITAILRLSAPFRGDPVLENDCVTFGIWLCSEGIPMARGIKDERRWLSADELALVEKPAIRRWDCYQTKI
jgi:hypothetical protein